MIGPETVLGAGSVVLAMAYVSSSCVLGRHVQISYNTTLGHDCRLSDVTTVLPGANVAGSVHLATGATVGSNAFVRQGLTVGAGAFVGAGAVVTKDVARADRGGRRAGPAAAAALTRYGREDQPVRSNRRVFASRISSSVSASPRSSSRSDISARESTTTPSRVKTIFTVRSDDPQVQPQRAALDVLHVQAQPGAPAHGVAAGDLGQPGDARTYVEPAAFVRGVPEVVLPQQRPRADDAHVAAQDVDQLRDLVQAQRAQQPAQPGEPPVVGKQVAEAVAAVGHRTELQHRERPAEHPGALLTEQHGRAEPPSHHDTDGEDQRREDSQPRQGGPRCRRPA